MLSYTLVCPLATSLSDNDRFLACGSASYIRPLLLQQFLRTVNSHALCCILQAVFRSHLGVIPATSAQFYTDDDTWAAFAKFAHLHSALGPYRQQLMLEAQASGMPLIRHTWLEFPQDPNTFNLTLQVR